MEETVIFFWSLQYFLLSFWCWSSINSKCRCNNCSSEVDLFCLISLAFYYCLYWCLFPCAYSHSGCSGDGSYGNFLVLIHILSNGNISEKPWPWEKTNWNTFHKGYFGIFDWQLRRSAWLVHLIQSVKHIPSLCCLPKYCHLFLYFSFLFPFSLFLPSFLPSFFLFFLSLPICFKFYF